MKVSKRFSPTDAGLRPHDRDIFYRMPDHPAVLQTFHLAKSGPASRLSQPFANSSISGGADWRARCIR